MKPSLSLILVLASAAAIVADQPTSVRVPFEMLRSGETLSGHLAVQVKVNGKGPYRLVFDTGAPVILLSRRVGKEAGLGGEKPSKLTTPEAKQSLMPGQVRIGKLEVGPLAADGVNAMVFDHPTVKALAEVFGPIDGIIGFPFFARYRTAIDYQSRTLTFTPNGYHPGDVVQEMMASLFRPRNGSDVPRVVGARALWGMRVEKASDDDEEGVKVAEVFPGGPAAKAGIKTGDRLLTLDGRWTDTVGDCYEAAGVIGPDHSVLCELRREGKSLSLSVTPALGL
jgi:hypothetical protein